MDLIEVNRTVLISVYNYLHKNGYTPANIYVDQLGLSIFNPIDSKSIKRLIKLDISKQSVRNLHFASGAFSFIASFAGEETRINVPYGSVIGYELHGRLCLTPTASQLDREEIEALFEIMHDKASTSHVQEIKSNVIALFPKEFQPRM